MLTVLRTPDPPTPSARPKLVRQEESELLMSYYQSPLADQGIGYRLPEKNRPAHRRSLSGTSNSTSSSDYSSSGSTDDDHSTEDVPQPSTRRASVPSEGGGDRRRLAIVQMDTVQEATARPNAVKSRRGHETRLDGLALIAPPDASPKSYAYLSLPSSASSMPRPQEKEKEKGPDKSHVRSASEATTGSTKSKPSRDVGIVGTATTSAALEPLKKPRLQIASESLLPVPPVFQEPHSSRASSPNTLASPTNGPLHSPLAPPQVKRRSTDMSVHTPEIGQAKEIHVPVASPVVVDLGPDASLRVGNSTFERYSPALQVLEPRSTSPLPLSSYLHYQPGIHATAGPLPPPPRAIFDIDTSSPPPPRPPRMHSPPPRQRGEQALHLSASVSAVLNSSGSTTPASTSRSISPAQPNELPSSGSSEDSNDETLHRREGAFSPSTISTTPSTSPSDYSPTTANPVRTIDGLVPSIVDGKSSGSGGSSSSAVVSPVIIPASPHMESLPEAGEEWTYVSRDLTASPSSDGHASQDRVSWESYSPRHSHEGTGSTPSPPPKSLRTSFTANLRRFSSLPRTPSPSSKSLARSSSSLSHGRTPSPPVAPVALPSLQPQMPRRRKIISQHPSALICADIVGRKNAQERCALYAQKINELYVHDCGLSEWVVAAQIRGANASKRITLTPLAPSTQRFGPQARHVSRSSVRSEATFPRRPDAMAATDLSTKPADIAPAVPSLPYPALSPRAIGVPIPLPPSSMRMLGTTSPGSSKTGNFFASLGRKASISKKERPNPMSFGLGSTTTTTRLVKSPPVTSNPRPVVIAISPSVPGGPRAPPNRALRTQSIMPTSSLTSNTPVSDRMARRPSLFTPGSSSSSEARSTGGGASGDRDFQRQVDKLADLLPQAERAVLAGYLRRAGQDILAIGQYLEDEKNGTLRRD
ncbi:hypothetical protein B0H11DRAFT_2218320 [Mycena galericulata]|nr:hypothetical protein B0H11DRAFT_2218320 [Mycena galericulata]